jgi:hypothetical protein
LERFLDVVDDDFSRVDQLASDLLEVHSVDEIPDAYLKLLGGLV